MSELLIGSGFRWCQTGRDGSFLSPTCVVRSEAGEQMVLAGSGTSSSFHVTRALGGKRTVTVGDKERT